MADGSVLTIHFKGDRFSNNSIPLEFLIDINSLDQMISTLAGIIYLDGRPERSRLPKGFKENYFLSISSVRAGSAVAEIALCRSPKLGSIEIPKEEEAFEEACSDIVRILSCPQNMMSEREMKKLDCIRPFFDKFGRHLRPGELMEFERAGSTALFDSRIRHEIINSNPEYSDGVELYGSVSAVDKKEETFKFSIKEDGRDIRLDTPVPGEFKDIILEAFNAYGDGQKVFLKAEGVFKKDRLTRLQNIEDIQILDVLDVQARLHELMDLKDGWCDGNGKAPEMERLRAVADLFERKFHSDRLPCIFPTPEGNIEAEWSIGDVEIILEIDLNSFKGICFSSNRSKGETRELELDLTADIGWSRLNEELFRAGA